jgi:hypothetical protein
MKKRIFLFIIFVFASTLDFRTVSEAVGVPALDLDALTASSDVILIGEVESITQSKHLEAVIDSGGNPPGIVRLATVRIAYPLKGSVGKPSTIVEFVEPGVPNGWQILQNTSYGVFFLRRYDGREFRLANPYFSYFAVLRDKPPLGSTPIEKLVSELQAVINFDSATESQKSTAMFYLSRIAAKASAAALKADLELRNRILTIRASGFLLERDDLSGLQIATSALLDTSQQLPSDVRHNVLYAISEGVKNSAAIPDLEQLSLSPEPDVRRAAASSLRQTGSTQAMR